MLFCGYLPIRCILSPSLATIIEAEFAAREANRRARNPQPLTNNPQPTAKSVWDLVALDEAHVACHLSAQVTQAIIRLQPRYRYALTATPIPNIVSNLFSIMGWLCVPGWHKNGAGGVPARNAAWPYARDEIHRFNDTFLSVERDHTQEAINQERNHRWRGKCIKTSPVISSPARLLKLLKPTLAFISKEMCHPGVVPCKVIDIRVPLGRQQARLYHHFMDRSHIAGANALVRARKQIAYLRGICADPADFGHGGPPVATNFNPKTVAVLELAGSILQRGEQVVIVSARVGQTDEFQRRLTESIGRDRLARIDSTVPASQHNAESNRFKLEEILATHLNQAAHRPISNSRDEAECESDWPRLRTQLESTTAIAPWRLRVRARN